MHNYGLVGTDGFQKQAKLNCVSLAERAMMLATMEKREHPHGLLPVADLDPTRITVHDTPRLLTESERNLLSNRQVEITASLDRALGQLTDVLPPFLPNFALHAWPRYIRSESDTFHTRPCIGPYRQPKTATEAVNLVPIVSGWDFHKSLLSFRDSRATIHLPVDYFLPGENDGLRELFIAEAIIGAAARSQDRVLRALQGHSHIMLRDAELFDWPGRGELLARVNQNQLIPFLALYGLFEDYSNQIDHHALVAATKPGTPEHQTARVDATLEYLRQQTDRLFPDAQREELIEQWMPADVSEVVQRVTKQFSIQHTTVALDRLQVAVRNLFAFQVLVQTLDLKPSTTSAPEDVSEIRRVFEQSDDRVSPQELLNNVFTTNQVTVIESAMLEYSFLLATLAECIPAHTLLVFPTALLQMAPLPGISGLVGEPTLIERAVPSSMTGNDRPLGDLGWDDAPQVNEQAHLLQTLRDRNKQGADITFFPAMSDDRPSLLEKVLSVDEFIHWSDYYVRRLRERIAAVQPRQTVILDINSGTTNTAFRKPDMNSPDLFHQALRAAFPREGGRGVPDVEIILHRYHHLQHSPRSSLADILKGWRQGSFALQGKENFRHAELRSQLPTELATRAVFRLQPRRTVYGNFNHLWVTVEGDHGGGDDDETAPEPAPEPVEGVPFVPAGA